MNERKPLDAYLHRVGQRRRPFRDIYVFLLSSRWPAVIAFAFTAFLAVNAIFGALFWAVPGSFSNSDGSYAAAFFFSVQTFASIGYGYMYSQGLYGNAVVVVESFVSLLSIALLTGIVFAKFARPHSRVLFSRTACVEQRDGRPTLTFRAANERGNDVVEASIRVSVLKWVTTLEGKRVRRFHDLALERSSSPVFLLSWQVFHPIDEESPLHGMSAEDMIREDVRITVALMGLDGTFSQTIHARHVYWADEIELGRRFVDVIENQDGGHVTLHFERFHDTVDDA